MKITPVNKAHKKRGSVPKGVIDRKRIRKLLIEKDFSVAGLARRVHKSRQWTSQVLYGHEKSEAMRKAIARALDMGVSDLWPASASKPNSGKRAA